MEEFLIIEKKNKKGTVVRRTLWQAYNNKCFYCANPIPFNNFHIDHVIPESLGNQEAIKLYNLDDNFELNSYSNLVPSCPNCNLRKQASTYQKKTVLFYLEEIKKKLPNIGKLEQKIFKSDKKNEISSIISTSLIDYSLHEILRIINEFEFPGMQKKILLEAINKSLIADLLKELIIPDHFKIGYYFIDFEEIQNLTDKSQLSLLYNKIKTINLFFEKEKCDESLEKVEECLDLIGDIFEEVSQKEPNKLEEIFTLMDYFHYRKLNLLIRLNQYEKVRESLKFIFSDLYSTYLLIDELIEKKKFDLAEILFQNPNYKEYQIIEGVDYHLSLKEDYYKKIGELDKLLELIDQYLDFRDLPEFYIHKLDILISLQKFDKALIIVNSAIKKYPEYPVDLIVLKKGKFISKYSHKFLKKNIGLLFLKEDEKDSDTEFYNSAGYLFSLYKAKILFLLKNYDEGLQLINQLLELNPKNVKALISKALALLELNKIDPIPDCLNQAIEIEPFNPISYSIKSHFYFQNKKYKKALDLIDKSIDLKPNIPEYLHFKSLVLITMKRYELALEILDRLIKEFPDNKEFRETKNNLMKYFVKN